MLTANAQLRALMVRLSAPPIRTGYKWAALFVLAIPFAYFVFPLMLHWEDIIRPAALAVLAGRSPYAPGGFFNPPWAILPFLPLALLPVKLGSAIVSAMTICAYALVGVKLGARPLVLALFLLAPFNVYTVVNVNEDFLVAVGLIMPPPIGLFFILIKPQVGGGLALLWLVQAFDKGGWREAVRVFFPVSIAFALSFLIFGFWPLEARNVNWQANTNLWPYAIPFGLALLARGLKDRDKSLAYLSAPLLSPYVGGSSFALFTLAFLPNQVLTLAMIAGTWAITFAGHGPQIYEGLWYHLITTYR